MEKNDEELFKDKSSQELTDLFATAICKDDSYHYYIAKGEVELATRVAKNIYRRTIKVEIDSLEVRDVSTSEKHGVPVETNEYLEQSWTMLSPFQREKALADISIEDTEQVSLNNVEFL